MVMAKLCEICGKKAMVGNNVSHAHNVTKRRFKANLKRVHVMIKGQAKRLVVCTKCLKTGRVMKAA